MKDIKKITVISDTTKTGGANIAALRVSELLKKKFTLKICKPNRNFFSKFKYYFSRFLINLFIGKTNYLNSLNLFSTVKLSYKNTDLIHIHWIGKELISLKALNEIPRPIIWTMHDMWPILATEHFINSTKNKEYLYDKDKYNFLKKIIINQKKKLFKKQIHLVANSNWLKNYAKKSFLTKNLKVQCIYNPIKTTSWKRMNTFKSKKILKLNTNKKYLFFGAHGGFKNYRKGGDLFVDSLKKLQFLSKEYEVVVIGSDRNYIKYINNFKFHFRKATSNLKEQLRYHSIADITIVPSREESLPQFAVETLLCNNPVVGFNIGGMKEIIQNKSNGFLAKPFSINDLAKGIIFSIKHLNQKKIFKKRPEIVSKFDEKKVLIKYKNLIKNINI